MKNADFTKLRLKNKIGVFANCNGNIIQVCMNVWLSAKIKMQ